ncbi:hypothetical protein J2Y54_002085 [Sphingomonas sp. BE123]|jgi:hypothetical protein|uniref:hypothetical protein n=1 Tax=Sphingomonas sp. BE123 TaxID=2817842 RepID=UPI00285D4270|nr:hypothetical protein [Sphingomonas sp. BE123]MDR6852565.1 hypothetical protein [Sphingomonas sp. BE123]
MPRGQISAFAECLVSSRLIERRNVANWVVSCHHAKSHQPTRQGIVPLNIWIRPNRHAQANSKGAASNTHTNAVSMTPADPITANGLPTQAIPNAKAAKSATAKTARVTPSTILPDPRMLTSPL